MKKLFAALMAIALLLSLCTTAVMAADYYSVTINKEEAGRKYEAYQIFIGDISVDDEGNFVLSNIEWGTGVTADGQAAIGDAQAKADTIITQADAEAFADEIQDYLTSTCTKAVYNADEKEYVINNLPAGYYLIKEEEDSLPDEKGYTGYILKVVGDTETDPKDGETTTFKKVDDKNDSTGAEDDIIWQDSADHDIGDLIDFKLEATIADNYDEYDNYFFAFHDVEDKGLTFQPDTVKVTIDGVEITDGYVLKAADECTDGCTFEIVFEDLKDIEAVKAGSTIVVTYKSRLNEDAVVGNKGNVNKVYGEFSRHPDEDWRGKTKDDVVIVFTYKVEVNKVDEKNEPLAGATFTLEKFVLDAEGTAEYQGLKGNWEAISTVETKPETTFTFNGLDDGYYRLVEAEAPEHYNKIDDVYFTVTAERDILWETQAREDVLTSLTGDVATGELQFTATKEDGKMSTDVVNKRGLILPETGGMGTYIFYGVGAALAIAAVVFLITKKRMNAHK